MMDLLIGILLIGGYIVFGIICIRFFKRLIDSLIANQIIRSLVLSFLYALVFGIGVLGGGGDPGFAMPFPILAAGIIDIFGWISIISFVNGIVFPLFIWWILIFSFLIISHRIRLNRRKKNKMESVPNNTYS